MSDQDTRSKRYDQIQRDKMRNRKKSKTQYKKDTKSPEDFVFQPDKSINKKFMEALDKLEL